MSFLAPERLLLVAVVAALAAAYVVLQRRRRRYAVRFTNLDLLDTVAPKSPGWRRHLTASLAGLAALAMIVGLAQPTAAVTVAREEAIVVLAIDTSTSMEATDVIPSRIEAAISEATAFVDELPEGILVGVVAFDGSARLVVAPTAEHDLVETAISQLTTAHGTAGGDAIETALDAIAMTLDQAEEVAVAGEAVETLVEEVAPAATIVMLSDGETTVGTTLEEASRLAVEAGVPVSTITFGTSSGAVTIEGQKISVPPADESMAELASATGGEAFAAADDAELASVYDDIEARVATTTEERDLSLGFVGAGLGLLVAAASLAFVWTGRFL